jgi:hypothetical protein
MVTAVRLSECLRPTERVTRAPESGPDAGLHGCGLADS